MSSTPVYNTGGTTTAPNRAPFAKVLAGALANNRAAQSLITALGSYYINGAIVATSVSQTTNFGGLLVGDLVIHVANASAPSMLGAASTFAALAYSAITGSTGAGSALTGNIGIFPTAATGITNFPPSSYSGTEYAADTTAQQAQAAAQAAYITFTTGSATSILPTLDGQTLVPGTYTTGAATLNGTLTFNGAGVYVIRTTSTLITGATGTPVMNLTNGATANNIYWAVSTAATINSAFPGTFQGSVITNSGAITVTDGGTVEGSLVALTSAITYSTTTISVAAAYTPGNTAGGVSFSTITTAGNLGYAATVGDLYLDLAVVNLDANNPIVPPPPAQLTGRVTGDGGLEF